MTYKQPPWPGDTGAIVGMLTADVVNFLAGFWILVWGLRGKKIAASQSI
jgi:hypothetical protein